jgi:hypothetical protein
MTDIVSAYPKPTRASGLTFVVLCAAVFFICVTVLGFSAFVAAMATMVVAGLFDGWRHSAVFALVWTLVYAAGITMAGFFGVFHQFFFPLAFLFYSVAGFGGVMLGLRGRTKKLSGQQQSLLKG